MSLTLDHLVILVDNLEKTIADYTVLGFTVQRGGIHADGATHNALVGFADGSYLELIAFLKPSPTHRWSRANDPGIEGFVDFALLPSSVGQVVDAARSRGLMYSGPIEGGRVRPDGERLAWQIGTPPTADLPFLCGDITPRALRVREGDVRAHPNGAQGVASVTLLVRSLATSLERYRALLGQEATRAARSLSVQGLGVRIATLALGSTTLVLVSPDPHDDDPAASALRRVLASRGEVLLGISLPSTAALQATLLPLPLTHGARIELDLV
jgi:catechol 2,3-dioxygenase-like lactoylglutathione lyase family enzyme